MVLALLVQKNIFRCHEHGKSYTWRLLRGGLITKLYGTTCFTEVGLIILVCDTARSDSVYLQLVQYSHSHLAGHSYEKGVVFYLLAGSEWLVCKW